MVFTCTRLTLFVSSDSITVEYYYSFQISLGGSKWANWPESRIYCILSTSLDFHRALWQKNCSVFWLYRSTWKSPLAHTRTYTERKQREYITKLCELCERIFLVTRCSSFIAITLRWYIFYHVRRVAFRNIFPFLFMCVFKLEWSNEPAKNLYCAKGNIKMVCNNFCFCSSFSLLTACVCLCPIHCVVFFFYWVESLWWFLFQRPQTRKQNIFMSENNQKLVASYIHRRK